jgi:hypothetical protein
MNEINKHITGYLLPASSKGQLHPLRYFSRLANGRRLTAHGCLVTEQQKISRRVSQQIGFLHVLNQHFLTINYNR